MTLRILCVDNDRDAADSTAELLGIWGYEARVCYSGIEVQEAVQCFYPDVFLIDIRMPGMTGETLGEWLRARTGESRPALIAITGCEREQDFQRSLDAGFDAHLIKPVEPALLLATIDRLSKLSDNPSRMEELPVSAAR